MEELGRQFKARTINEEDLKEAVRDIVKGYGKDIGIDFEVAYLDEFTMPKKSKGSTGSSYIVDRKNRKVLIPIDVNKIEDIKELLGTVTEEVAHGKDALEGRQDKKVAEDKSNDEEGLETLGRPANEYVKKKFGEDSNSKIKLSTDGIDLSNADVGEKVGDVLLKSEIDAVGGVEKVLTPTTNEKIFKVVRVKSNQEVAVEFYQGVTNKTLWTGIYDFTSGVGDAKGIIEGLTGEDIITGEKINFFNRLIGGIPLIGRATDIFKTVNKPIKKGADFLVNLILDSSKGISKIDNINDTTKLVRVAEGVGDLGSDVTKAVLKEIKAVDNSANITKASKNIEKTSDVLENITKVATKEVKVIDKSNETGKIAKNTKGMKPIKKEQALEDIFTKEQEILKTSNPNIGVKDINKNGIKIKYDKEKYIKQIEDIKLGDLNGKKQKT